jgi:uncharacterized protein YbcI
VTIVSSQQSHDGPPAAPSPSLFITNQIVQLLARYTGRGPTKARTTLNTNVVTIVLQDTLTRGEQSLVAAGQHDAVRETRRTLHDLMREEAILVVEQVLNRRATAFTADVDPKANVAALVITLEPQPGTERESSEDAPDNGIVSR